MSVMFPKRGRRQNTFEGSFVDLDPPPPISEKRHQSPFSILRMRKRSTESLKKSSPQHVPAVRRQDSADSFSALRDMKSLPPVPPLMNHNRGYSDPHAIRGALVYPQVRSPGPESDSSFESTAFPPTPPSHPGRYATQWDAPPSPPSHPGRYATQWDAPSEDPENMLQIAHALLPTPGPSPMLAAAAVMNATHSTSSQEFPSFSRAALGPEGHAGHAAHLAGQGHGIVASIMKDKAKIVASVEPLINTGMQNLTKAQTVVDELVASEAWGVVKENAKAVLAPAQDVVTILDSVVKYIPAVMVAESIFAVIIKHELERSQNDKNILVVYHTMTVFWFTMCDLQAIFRADHEHIKSSLDTFFQDVSKTIQDFGNFREVYYRHGHFSRTLRSSEYRKKLAAFTTAFATHKADLHFILSESSALQINDMSTDVNNVAASVSSMSAKLDAVTAQLGLAIQAVAKQTPLELAVAKQVADNGGEQALQDPSFLNQLARTHFGAEGDVSAQAQANLKQGLDEALSANIPTFTLKVEAAQKEMGEAVERSTDAILQQLNSGPYQLIKDEDIKSVWQTVHNYFAQKLAEERNTKGEVHADQWALNVLSQVIYYPNISDAIDDDGSGYISVHEVNHFFKSRPKEWSALQWLAYWATGWKQNALAYKDRCKLLFSEIEATARTVHPQNRRSVKSYIKTSGLSELWLVVNSVTPDGLARRSAQHSDAAPLNALMAEMMRKETEHIHRQLERIKHRLDSPETVLAVLGTHRLEGFILCFLELVLDRHRQILEAANTLVISEQEFDMMTFSLKNLVTAFGTRYRTLTESWKQQRLDTGFLVQCFAGGIFNDWHEVFEDGLVLTLGQQPIAHVESTEIQKNSSSYFADRSGHPRSSSQPQDILIFPLPPQPTSPGYEDPGSPPSRLAPPPMPKGPRRRSMQGRHNPHDPNSVDYFYHFDFERRPSERPVSIVDPASISEVYRKKTTKKPKLEDRITSLETELSDIKGMLSQLIQLSTPRSES
ncbi:hypothetical protein GGX14DRAFT_570374 [Mycena pura]|uniref:EF-hand domain-containing protein n=1 Tax=Mycena pura TaxID=153505 RepID=A0AAD6V506_9AGAR|nr:hypothetical protein GGX14DRAFT_570374 [Mycena pura]